MNTPTEQEICRAAASLRLTGELLEHLGSRTLAAAESWSRGPKSPNLDPNVGGWRYDENGEPVPNDTTGEAAVSVDFDAGTHAEVVALITRMDEDGYRLRTLMARANPDAGARTISEPDTPAQVSAAGWCVSCHRDGGYCEPVSMRPDGTRRYRDFCTWCGEWVAHARTVQPKAKKKGKKAKRDDSVFLPPVELVRAKHRGQRITKRMVDDALAKKAS